MNFEKINSDGSSKPGSSLGSLTQAARSKEIGTARGILFFVSGWMIFSLVVEWFMAQPELDRMRAAGAGPALMAQIENMLYLFCGIYILVSIVFFVFGLVVKKYPVPITVSGLVVFVGMLASFAAITESIQVIVSGWWLKLIVIFGLAKAIQAAIAYQKELDANPVLPTVDDETPPRKEDW